MGFLPYAFFGIYMLAITWGFVTVASQRDEANIHLRITRNQLLDEQKENIRLRHELEKLKQAG
jgi:hypothetical protein